MSENIKKFWEQIRENEFWLCRLHYEASQDPNLESAFDYYGDPIEAVCLVCTLQNKIKKYELLLEELYNADCWDVEEFEEVFYKIREYIDKVRNEYN